MKIYQVMDCEEGAGDGGANNYFQTLESAKEFYLECVDYDEEEKGVAIFAKGTWEPEGDGLVCWIVDGYFWVIFEHNCK